MKVCTDSCLFGAWVATKLSSLAINPKRIADIGTGTGLLSLMLAQKCTAGIDAVDIDVNAFLQARENFQASPWHGRLHVFHAGIKEWIAPCKYDLIIANPPFYENDLLPANPGKSISKHNSGMNFEDLLSGVKNMLNEHGNFAVLLPFTRTQQFEKLASAYSLFVNEKIEVKQTSGHNYFRTILLLQAQKITTVTGHLTIKNDNNEYTPEFIELLKDYYLYL